jgi:hypothetical protein
MFMPYSSTQPISPSDTNPSHLLAPLAYGVFATLGCRFQMSRTSFEPLDEAMLASLDFQASIHPSLRRSTH